MRGARGFSLHNGAEPDPSGWEALSDAAELRLLASPRALAVVRQRTGSHSTGTCGLDDLVAVMAAQCCCTESSILVQPITPTVWQLEPMTENQLLRDKPTLEARCQIHP